MDKHISLKFYVYMLFLTKSRVSADTIAEIKLVTYNIPGGVDFYGNPCDANNPFATGCDPYFRICIDQPDSDPDMSNCKYKDITTHFYQDQNYISFGMMINGGVRNPIEVTVPNWEGGITMKIAVTDKDFQLDDAIDTIYYTYNAVPEGTVQESTWRSLLIKGTRSFQKTELRVQIRVYCQQNWFGPGCLVYCDTARTDGFSCDNDTGRPFCKAGTRCQPTTTTINNKPISTTQDTNVSPQEGLSAGSAVGITLAVVVAIILIIFTFLIIHKRHKPQNDNQRLQEESRSRWFFIRIYYFFFGKAEIPEVTDTEQPPALTSSERLALPAPSNEVTDVKRI